MPYTPNEWIDGDKSRPLSAARLSHMETQHAKALADVQAQIGDPDSPIGSELNTA